MKMLKKAAAVLLAAAMSLTMLTACGGGSGSTSQYKMARILAESEKTGKLYIDATIDQLDIGAKVATDKKTGKTIVAVTQDGELADVYMTTADGTQYEINSESKDESDMSSLYWKKTASNPTFGAAMSSVPSSDKVSSMKIVPEYKYGEETYYAEVLTDGSTEVAYCFKNDALVYIVVKSGNLTIGEKVNAIQANFPDKIADVIPVSYDAAMNFKMVG